MDTFQDEKPRPALAPTPTGHRSEARLDRRLKGKAVTARSPLLGQGGAGGEGGRRAGGNQGGGNRRQQGGGGNRQQGGGQPRKQFGGGQQQHLAAAPSPMAMMGMAPVGMHMGQPQDMVPEGEVPW